MIILCCRKFFFLIESDFTLFFHTVIIIIILPYLYIFFALTLSVKLGIGEKQSIRLME